MKWQKAKADAARMQESRGRVELARKLDACKMFKGDESLEEMIGLMFSAQGAEFLTKYGFPDLATFRKFKKHHPERFGVYIDYGDVLIKDEKRVFLVGKTIAKIDYQATQANRLVMMHGAKAEVEASGRSVVRIETDGSCIVEVTKNDHAKVLQ